MQRGKTNVKVRISKGKGKERKARGRGRKRLTLVEVVKNATENGGREEDIFQFV